MRLPDVASLGFICIWECLWFNDFGFVAVFVLFDLGSGGGRVIHSG